MPKSPLSPIKEMFQLRMTIEKQKKYLTEKLDELFKKHKIPVAKQKAYMKTIEKTELTSDAAVNDQLFLRKAKLRILSDMDNVLLGYLRSGDKKALLEMTKGKPFYEGGQVPWDSAQKGFFGWFRKHETADILEKFKSLVKQETASLDQKVVPSLEAKKRH